MNKNVDVKELTKMIEFKINEINSKTVFDDEDELNNTIFDLTKLTEEIENRIKELEIEESSKNNKDDEYVFDFTLNINKLTDKINKKLDDMDFDDELEKTIYDLREITEVISKTISKMEKTKEKKLKKKKYCDLARKGIIVNKKKDVKKVKKSK